MPIRHYIGILCMSETKLDDTIVKTDLKCISSIKINDFQI